MKTTHILIAAIALIAFASTASAQTDQPAEDALNPKTEFPTPSDDIQKTKKGWWQFGVTARVGNHFFYTTEAAVVLGAGYRFNKKNYLGLNVGIAHAENNITVGPGFVESFPFIGCPITAEYKHNFFLGKAKKHSIYLGAEAGFLSSFGQKGVWEDSQGEFETEEHTLGEAITYLKFGMDFQLNKKLNMNFGFNVGVLALGASLGFTF